MPNPLITLNCPNCGGTLVSAGADRYVCSYCGSEHRLRDHPDWLQSLQENLDHLKTQLSDVQSNSRVAAAAQQLPGLLISLRQLTQTLQAWARAAFVSLLVLGTSTEQEDALLRDYEQHAFVLLQRGRVAELLWHPGPRDSRQTHARSAAPTHSG